MNYSTVLHQCLPVNINTVQQKCVTRNSNNVLLQSNNQLQRCVTQVLNSEYQHWTVLHVSIEEGEYSIEELCKIWNFLKGMIRLIMTMMTMTLLNMKMMTITMMNITMMTMPMMNITMMTMMAMTMMQMMPMMTVMKVAWPPPAPLPPPCHPLPPPQPGWFPSSRTGQTGRSVKLYFFKTFCLLDK